MRCATCFVLLYLGVAFWTLAWTYDDYEKCRPNSICQSDRALYSVFAAVLWPAFWTAKGSLYAVRYVKANKPFVSWICKDLKGNTWKPTHDGYCVVPDYFK